MNGVVEVVEEKHSRKKYQQEQKQGRQATAHASMWLQCRALESFGGRSRRALNARVKCVDFILRQEGDSEVT